jgi:hypothetical protein
MRISSGVNLEVDNENYMKLPPYGFDLERRN